MKKLLALLFSVVALATFSGCGTLAPGVYDQDEILYRADTAITTGYDVLHAFVAFEYANRAALASKPEIKRAADRVRTHAPLCIGSAIALREAYAAAPTRENRDKLQASLAVLRAALLEATTYLNAHQPALPPS
jgi:hypothetical protein